MHTLMMGEPIIVVDTMIRRKAAIISRTFQNIASAFRDQIYANLKKMKNNDRQMGQGLKVEKENGHEQYHRPLASCS